MVAAIKTVRASAIESFERLGFHDERHLWLTLHKNAGEDRKQSATCCLQRASRFKIRLGRVNASIPCAQLALRLRYLGHLFREGIPVQSFEPLRVR